MNKGNTLSLRCTFESYPRANCSWLKNDALYKSDCSEIVFDKISRTDAGNYTCQARNAAGEDSFVSQVHVHCK